MSDKYAAERAADKRRSDMCWAPESSSPDAGKIVAGITDREAQEIGEVNRALLLALGSATLIDRLPAAQTLIRDLRPLALFWRDVVRDADRGS